MALKAIQDTFIYNQLNSANAITKNIGAAITKGIVIKPEQVEDQLSYIRRSYKHPLKFKVLEMIEQGKILMVYSPSNTKIPTAIPFILMEIEDEITPVVFVDTYGTMDPETGMINIQTEKLYTMLEGAVIAKYTFLKQESLVNKTNVSSYGSRIFAEMFTKVLSKKYSLGSDMNRFHKVIVLASKYYFMNVLGRQDSELVMNYCIKNCKNGNPIILQELYESFPNEAFENLDTFITEISELKYGLGLRGLTTKVYIEGFINMYDSSALMSLENFNYFMYTIIATMNNAYINNQYSLSTIIGNDGAKLYLDLTNIVK